MKKYFSDEPGEVAPTGHGLFLSHLQIKCFTKDCINKSHGAIQLPLRGYLSVEKKHHRDFNCSVGATQVIYRFKEPAGYKPKCFKVKFKIRESLQLEATD